VHSRILFGLVAWLLGAATATAGSLLAVSLLGQGIAGTQGQLLTQDAVNRALASEAAQGSAPAVPSVSASQPPSPPASATPSAVATSVSPSATAVATTAPPAVSSSSPSPASSSTAPPASAGGAVLTSPGGQVVANCQAAGAYLISWSPLQGYQVGDVSRGPAATARVTFESHANKVSMLVTCSAGVPSATSHTWVDE
jgi:serine/threonine-protein kinase